MILVLFYIVLAVIIFFLRRFWLPRVSWFEIWGGLIGLLAVLAIFFICWMDAAKGNLLNRISLYESGQVCLPFKNDQNALFEKAIELCNTEGWATPPPGWGSGDCLQEFNKVNEAFIKKARENQDSRTDAQIMQQAKINFIQQRCWFKYPVYDKNHALILRTEPEVETMPTYLSVLFDRDSLEDGLDIFLGMGYLPPLLLFVLLLPLEGVFIGRLISKII